MLNGIEQRSLEATEFDQARGIEETKAEAARIFEVIKTGNPDQAAKNLKFLVDVGLISDPGRIKSIKALDLEGNQLPALPPIISQPPINWDEPQPIGRPPKPGGKSKEVR